MRFIIVLGFNNIYSLLGFNQHERFQTAVTIVVANLAFVWLSGTSFLPKSPPERTSVISLVLALKNMSSLSAFLTKICQKNSISIHPSKSSYNHFCSLLKLCKRGYILKLVYHAFIVFILFLFLFRYQWLNKD